MLLFHLAFECLASDLLCSALVGAENPLTTPWARSATGTIDPAWTKIMNHFTLVGVACHLFDSYLARILDLVFDVSD